MLTVGQQSNEDSMGFYDSGDDVVGKDTNDIATKKKVRKYMHTVAAD
jgi:hypothetical protein